jgi:glyoxylase-like metal-dependent hydrolase (beta-lactamase superfamily II)
MGPDRSPFPELDSLELVAALARGDTLQVVDVRAPERVSSGRLDVVPPERYVNLPGSRLRALDDLAGTGIAGGLRTIVVCGRGNDSRLGAAHLRSLGIEAYSLRGGMAAWMDALVPREVEPPAALDRLVQFDRVGKGSLTYLLVSGGDALVVDPPRHADAVLEVARNAGARITGVADTHVHADYVSGASALARMLGVPYHLHPADNCYPFDGTPGRLAVTPLADGSTIRLGRATLEARHNPGHTEGSTSLALPGAIVLSGDFVFVESVGRPDLAGRADAWARLLWDSLVRAKTRWAPDELVLPGHYSNAGERRSDGIVAARFRDLLASNTALGIEDRTAFLAWAGAPAHVPPNYPVLKAVNAGLRTVGEDEATELDIGRNECAVARASAAG